MSLKISNALLNTFRVSAAVGLIVTGLAVRGYYKAKADIAKESKAKREAELASYRLPNDEFVKLKGEIEKGARTYQQVFDSLDQDKIKQVIEKIKQSTTDNFNKAISSAKK